VDAFGSVLLQTPMWRHEGDSTEVTSRRRGSRTRIGPEAAQPEEWAPGGGGVLLHVWSQRVTWALEGRRRRDVAVAVQPAAGSVREELSAHPQRRCERVGDPKGVHSAAVKTFGLTNIYTGRPPTPWSEQRTGTATPLT